MPFEAWVACEARNGDPHSGDLASFPNSLTGNTMYADHTMYADYTIYHVDDVCVGVALSVMRRKGTADKLLPSQTAVVKAVRAA
jgi:hypothetical protein